MCAVVGVKGSGGAARDEMEIWAQVGRCAMACRRRYVMLRTQLFSARSCDDITDASNARAGALLSDMTCTKLDSALLWYALLCSAAPHLQAVLLLPSDFPATLSASLWVPCTSPVACCRTSSLTVLGEPTSPTPWSGRAAHLEHLNSPIITLFLYNLRVALLFLVLSLFSVLRS
jgi:hypothetical protein